MKLARTGLVVMALAGCSELASSDDTVVALQVTAPPGSAVEVGDTVTYTVVAVNRNGDPIPAPIYWSTPDTLVIAVDSVSGVVLGKSPGQGRVQAISDGLVSPLNILTVVATCTAQGRPLLTYLRQVLVAQDSGIEIPSLLSAHTAEPSGAAGSLRAAPRQRRAG